MKPDEKENHGISPDFDLEAAKPKLCPDIRQQADEFSRPTSTSSNADDTTEERATSLGKESDKVINWDGPDDPENPLNWTLPRKWTATILVSCFTFMSPFASTMVTPALDDIGTQFNVAPGFSRVLMMSIFLLGYAQGPFVLAPLSEVYGRVRVLQYANLIFLAFNTACGFATSYKQLLAFRFLSGIGGSAPQALCNGVLADCWKKEERGKGQAIYGILTFLGPTVAPIVGAYISINTTWRWIFWTTSILDVVIQASAVLLLQETYAPTILARKAKKLQKATNQRYLTPYDQPDKTTAAIIRRRLILPMIMMFTHPAVQIPSLHRAFLYGVMYLVLSTFPRVWVAIYNMARGISSLNYLSLGIGFIIGLQLSHPLIDKLYAKMKRDTKNDEGVPEWRVPPMIIGGILCPAGLLIYGWSARLTIHWIVPNIGCALLAIGLIIAFQSSQAYVVDTYSSRYSASAAAVGAFMRTMCGFSFPLFAPAMYNVLGLGWGNTLLAGITVVLGILTPIFLWFYGSKLRAMSHRGLQKT